MADKTPNDPKSKKTDPRLKSFLRKASAIIASERGLNASSRLKLQSLADHDSLPKHLFDQAIEQLQTNDSPTLTRYEKLFIQFLEKEFENLGGDVLSPSAEKKAIVHAEKKYQINGTRAEQLLQIQAETSGIARISTDDGYAFADSFIVEKIGDSVAVDEETQEEIYQIGTTWGINQRRVDEIIARQIKRNRDSRKSKFFSKILPWLGMAAVIASITTIGIQRDWFKTTEREPAPTLDLTANGTAESKVRFPWLSEPGRNRLTALVKDNDAIARIFDRIESDTSSQQKLGIQQLIQLVCSSDIANSNQTQSLAVETVYQFPQLQSSLSAIQPLESYLFPAPTSKDSVKRLKDAYRANRLLGEMLFYPQPQKSPLRTAIENLAQSVSNVETSPVDPMLDLQSYLKISEAEVASRQWNDLFQKSWTETRDSARLVQPLLEITQDKLAPQSLVQFRDEAALNILSINPEYWRDIETPIVSSIETCDESTLLKWLNLFVEVDNNSLQTRVGEALAKRLKLKTNSNRIADTIEAVKKYEFQFRYRQLQPVFDRNELLQKLVVEISDKESLKANEIVSPDRIAQIALAINIELAFHTALENASRIDGSAFTEFDRLIALPSPRLRELVAIPSDRQKADESEQSTAMASDRRRMESALSRLAAPASDDSGLRGLALNQLERVAHRFKAIPYSDAKILANYFLTTKNIEERLQIEKQIESFSHWPNLALAMADQLPSCQLERGSTTGMIRSLLGTEFDELKWDDWKRDLQTRMMLSIASQLDAYVDRDPDNTRSDWSRLKVYLNDIYRERLIIVKDQEFTHGNNYDRPIVSTVELLQFLASSMQPSQKLKLERAASLVDSLSENQVTQTIYAEQLLIQAFAAELIGSPLESDSLSILAEIKEKRAESTGNELYETELRLLRMIDLRRKWLVTRLVEGNQ